MKNASDNGSVLEKVAEILDVFGEAPQQFTFTDVAERTNLSKGSVHRLMGQLVDIQFLEKAGTAKSYQLGERLLRLVHFNLESDVLKGAFGPELQGIADTLSEAAFAAHLKGSEIELFDVRGPLGQNKSYIHPGMGLRPAHACSSAKCILAHQKAELLPKFLDVNLQKFTDSTLVERNAVVRQLEEVRRNGFAICDEEIEQGVFSIACPILVRQVGVIYSIGIVAPKRRVGAKRLEAIRGTLLNSANRLENLLSMHERDRTRAL